MRQKIYRSKVSGIMKNSIITKPKYNTNIKKKVNKEIHEPIAFYDDLEIKELCVEMVDISKSMDDHREYMNLYYKEFEENMGFIKTIKVIFKKIINLFK